MPSGSRTLLARRLLLANMQPERTGNAESLETDVQKFYKAYASSTCPRQNKLAQFLITFAHRWRAIQQLLRLWATRKREARDQGQLPHHHQVDLRQWLAALRR
jgi:hypothetical protein